jgi:hypothetical protein
VSAKALSFDADGIEHRGSALAHGPGHDGKSEFGVSQLVFGHAREDLGTVFIGTLLRSPLQ